MIKKIRKSIKQYKEKRELVHHRLKTVHPKAVKRAKKIFGFKYPKLALFAITLILAYFLFKNAYFLSFVSALGEWSYFGIFIAGLFFSFGFTTPFAVAFFLAASPDNIVLAAIVGGIGAVISDFVIFKTIKISMMDEFEELEKDLNLGKIKQIIEGSSHLKAVHYILYIFAGLVIASPLPDEIGVSMLAGLSTIKEESLLTLSFMFNTLGIIVMLLI